ncbi:prephenate dehydratase [Algisphaera agarilytica]|uniref:Bifunctional chorismate mutase/prephenate dehydratase n=1 Tax=Algisphaera agarilytica TaxID=1385975 RepID=A0A7X0H8H6_9BACT|nr:prephenate dehydratase [Algisphaera agarilytica]MBB6431201.1 chorismate mutase/prephenate dehydratase [Algisphaera agarilytica]
MSQDPTTPDTDARDEAQRQLAPLRSRIDELDEKIVKLLNERADIVIEVGHIKRAAGEAVPIYAPDREQAVMQKIRNANAGPLPDACVQAIWRELMSGSFALERPLRIGYLGPAGSFSHLAARKKFGASVDYDELTDFPAIFDEVARGHVDYGLIPIENSTHGGVTASLDCFLDTPVKIAAEVRIAIHHNLLSRQPLDQITRVYSHQQALGQCRRWLSAQLPNAEQIATVSTSQAAALAAEEPGAAAIGSTLAAQLNDVPILFDNIEDNPNNETRFFVIARQNAKPSGDDKTSILFTTEHKAGALTDVLNVFRDHGLNLTRLAERPSQRMNWEYYFFVDVEGHADEPHMQKALSEAKKHCLQLTVLGSFPRAREVL